jgi:hypothetical protein
VTAARIAAALTVLADAVHRAAHATRDDYTLAPPADTEENPAMTDTASPADEPSPAEQLQDARTALARVREAVAEDQPYRCCNKPAGSICVHDISDADQHPEHGPDDGLREEYAAAIEADASRPSGERIGIINAILTVRDRELEQLRKERNTLERMYYAAMSDVGRLVDAKDAVGRELEQLRFRTVQAEELQRIAHDTSNKSEAARAQAQQRAETAEAAITRVRALADRWKRNGTSDLGRYADIMLTELAEPGQEQPGADTELLEHIARAIYRSDWPNGIWERRPEEDHATYRRNAEAALAAIQDAYVPPPPGSDREQLPDHLLALIRPELPFYLSTACSTGQLLACDLDQPHASERNTRAEQLHARCRLNHKFTGQLCCCDCHDEPAAKEAPR